MTLVAPVEDPPAGMSAMDCEAFLITERSLPAAMTPDFARRLPFSYLVHQPRVWMPTWA
jgi:hypothetical protein